MSSPRPQYAVRDAGDSPSWLDEAGSPLHLALEAMQAHVFDWNVREGTIQRSRGCSQLLGFGGELLDGTPEAWTERLHPEDMQRVTAQGRVATAAREPRVTNEYRVRHADGSWLWVQEDSRLQYAADGSVQRVVGCLFNIDARKRAELALRDREQRLRLALHGARMGTWTAYMDGRKGEADETALELLGATPEEWIRDPERVRSRFVVEDTERVQRALHATLQDGAPYEIEFRIRRADGSLRWVASYGQADRDPQGKVVAIRGVTADISARKAAEQALQESEARYRGLIGVLPAGVYACDAEGRLTYFNERAAELWGQRPQVGDAGQRFCGAWRLFAADGRPLSLDQAAVAIAIREGRGCRNQEAIIEQPGGRRLNVLVNVEPLRDAHGRIIGAINAFSDITERKAAEARISGIRDALSADPSSTDDLEPLRETREARVATPSVRAPRAALPVAGPLAAGPEAGFDQITRLAAGVLQAPAALFTVLDEERLVCVSGYGLPGAAPDTDRGALRATPYCRFVIEGEAPVSIHDARCNPLSSAMPPGSDGVIAYLATPVRDRNGTVIGSLAVADSVPRAWTRRDLLTLQGISRLLMHELELRFVLRDLAASEGKFRESDTLLRTVLSSTPDLVWVKDREGRITLGNEATFAVLGGGDQGRVLGGDAQALVPHAEEARTIAANDARVLQEGRSMLVEERFTTGGEQRLYQTIKAPLRAAGGDIVGIVGVSRDVTAQKQVEEALRESERRMQQALRTSGSFTFEWERGTDLVRRSGSCADVLGLAEYEAVHGTGQRYLERMHPDDREAFLALLTRLTPRAPGYAGHEYRVLRDDGSQVTLEEVGQGHFDAAGRLVRVVGIATDVTERRRAEQALRDADRRKDEFLAMLAHELRNPLAPIRNASALLSRMLADDARVQAPLAMIGRQSGQLTRLVDDLLDVSRIAQGRIELHPEVLEVGEILEQAIEAVQPMVGEKRHALQVHRPAGKLYVRGDRVRLVQAASNVLHNAAKYTPPGGTITVAVGATDHTLEVEVRDDGVGIPAELLPHVFDLFVQSEQTLDRSQGGLGIGLSVVKRLVEMHQGTVEVHSPGTGRGSTFTIRLRRCAAPQPVAPAPEARAPVRPRRILVVDDNVDAADSLTMLLKLEGHEARAVYGAAAALAAIEAQEPEVVLLDIGMPEMDGYEVARRIRGRNAVRSMRLVALTGYGLEADLARSRAAGFDAHLIKPADPEALARLLDGPAPEPGRH
jgi:PAS domain S-box-containing protein